MAGTCRGWRAAGLGAGAAAAGAGAGVALTALVSLAIAGGSGGQEAQAGGAGRTGPSRPLGLSSDPCASFWDVPRCSDTLDGTGVGILELAGAPYNVPAECLDAWGLGEDGYDEGDGKDVKVCKLHVSEVRPTQFVASESDAACRSEWFSTLWWRGAAGQREVTEYLAKRPLPVMAWGLCPARGVEPPSNATDPLGLPLASRGQESPRTSSADVSTYGTLNDQPDAWGDYTLDDPPCYYATDHHHQALGLARSQVPYAAQEVLVTLDENKGFKKAFKASSPEEFWEEMHDEKKYWSGGPCGVSPSNPLELPGGRGQPNPGGAPSGQELAWLFQLRGDIYRGLSKHLEMAGVVARKKKADKEYWQFKIADAIRNSEAVAEALGLLQAQPGQGSSEPAAFVCDGSMGLQGQLLAAALPKAAEYIRSLPSFVLKDLDVKVRGAGEQCKFDFSRAYRKDLELGYEGCSLFLPEETTDLYREAAGCTM